MVLANVRLPHKLVLLVVVAAIGFAALCGLALQALGAMQAQARDALQRQGGPEAEHFAQYAASSWHAVLLAGVVVAVASLLLIGLVALWAQRGIVVPVRGAALAARRIADGDLTTEVPVIGRGEVAKMLRSLAQMTQDLRRLVGEVASA